MRVILRATIPARIYWLSKNPMKVLEFVAALACAGAVLWAVMRGLSGVGI